MSHEPVASYRGAEAGEEIPDGARWENVWVGVPRGSTDMMFRYEIERAVCHMYTVYAYIVLIFLCLTL